MPPKKSSKMSSVETEGSPAAETIDKKIKTKRAAAAAAAASAAAAAADINVENESANSENDELVTPDQFQKSNVNKKRGRKPKG